MKYLLGFCLCVVSTAFGGDGIAEFPDGIAETPDSVRLTIDEDDAVDMERDFLRTIIDSKPEIGADLEQLEKIKESARKRLKELDAEVSGDKESADDVDEESEVSTTVDQEEIEWRPRLVVTLQIDNSVIKTERVANRSKPEDGRGRPQVNYRERQVRVFDRMPETATLYCDSVSLNVSEDGDKTSFELKCETRISLHHKGGVFTSNAGIFYDGKCELLNATFTHNGMTVKADKLTLTLPIHGVATNKFGTAIPAPVPSSDSSTEYPPSDSRSRLTLDPDDETVRSAPVDAESGPGQFFDEPEPIRGRRQENDLDQQREDPETYRRN